MALRGNLTTRFEALDANESTAARLSEISTIGDIPCTTMLPLRGADLPTNNGKALLRPRLDDVNRILKNDGRLLVTQMHSANPQNEVWHIEQKETLP